MDALSLLRALAALALYPGGMFLLGCAVMARLVLSGRSREEGWSAADAGAAASLLLAVSQLPVPGSAALLLPPGGAPVSLLTAVVCVGAALGAAGLAQASRRDAALAVSVLLPVGALAGVTASLGFAALVIDSDSLLVLVARVLAGGCMVVAVGALLVRARAPALLHGMFTAAVAATAAMLAVPRQALDADGWKVALLLAAATAAYALALRLARLAHRGGGITVMSCAAASVCSVALLLGAAFR